MEPLLSDPGGLHIGGLHPHSASGRHHRRCSACSAGPSPTSHYWPRSGVTHLGPALPAKRAHRGIYFTGENFTGGGAGKNLQRCRDGKKCNFENRFFFLFLKSSKATNDFSLQVLFTESSSLHADSFSYTVTGLRPWTRYEFSVRTRNPAGDTLSPWVPVTTRPAPPEDLAPPTVHHLRGKPSEVLVSWSAPAQPNGLILSYRIQRNSVNFSFSVDPTVLSYTDEGLQPFSTYR